MDIRLARREDIDELMDFFDEMCREFDRTGLHPNGNRGGFPPLEMVETAIEEEALHVGIEDSRIVATCIMDHKQDEAYGNASWRVDAKPDQVSVLHALRVLPQYGGRGFSKKLLGYLIGIAKGNAQKCIRLDCLEGNVAPLHLYESFGFETIENIDMTYPDIGIPMGFSLLELSLTCNNRIC